MLQRNRKKIKIWSMSNLVSFILIFVNGVRRKKTVFAVAITEMAMWVPRIDHRETEPAKGHTA